MPWKHVKIGDVVKPIDRWELVSSIEMYGLLGMRSKIGGPFLRETKSGGEISAKKLNRVAEGDFIYSRLFAWQGSFGLVPKSLSGSFVSNEFPIFEVDATKVDPMYLMYWFGLPSTQKRVEHDCYGSTPGTRNRFHESFFYELKIPLPSVQSQKKIAQKLEMSSKAIQEVNALASSTHEELNALMYSLHKAHCEPTPMLFGELVQLDELRISVEPDEAYPQLGIRSFGNGLFFKSAVKGAETSYKRFNKVYSGALIVSQPKGWEGAIAVAKGVNGGVKTYQMAV